MTASRRRPPLTNGLNRLARRSPVPQDKPQAPALALPPITGEAKTYWSVRRAVRASSLLKVQGDSVAARYLRAIVKWRWARVVVEMSRDDFADPYGVAATAPAFLSMVTTPDQLAWLQPGTYGVVFTGAGYTEDAARRIQRSGAVLEARAAELIAATDALAIEAERKGIDASDVFTFAERMRAGILLLWGQETMVLMDRGALLAQRVAARS